MATRKWSSYGFLIWSALAVPALGQGQREWYTPNGSPPGTPPTIQYLEGQSNQDVTVVRVTIHGLWKEVLDEEGGPEARARRYGENRRVLREGMRKLGFRQLLDERCQSHIITSFHYPHADFDFPSFYDRLNSRGHVIYPGKLGDVDTFRIGTIGSIGTGEIRGLLKAVAEVVEEGI